MSEHVQDDLDRMTLDDLIEYGYGCTEYTQGWIAGVMAYAWWKDGSQYVGTTGTELKQAIRQFLREARS